MEQSREAGGVQSLEWDENNAEWALSVYATQPSHESSDEKKSSVTSKGELRPIRLSQFNDR
jgi:hypothetical protein